MMSTTARQTIKPKNLTLLELSQSISDFRRPPASVVTSSYTHRSSPHTAQIMTRRLYLHPLTINPNSKQQLPKTSTATTTPCDSEEQHQLSPDKNRKTHHRRNKSTHRGLAVLSSSFPLISRINPKSDTRHSRDKPSVHTDSDLYSDYDASTTSVSLNQPSLPSLARGTFSSTHKPCPRPAYLTNHRQIHKKPIRLEKINVWNHLDRTLERPMPLDPPTTPYNPPPTPFGSVSDFNIEYDQSQNHYLNYNSIQEIQIYKRKSIHIPFINEDNDYDDYIYNPE